MGKKTGKGRLGQWFKCVAVVSLLAAGALMPALAAGADNLVPDPKFERADFATRPHYQAVVEKGLPWIFHIIEQTGNCDVVKDGAAVTISGGKTFLHSSRFKVEPGVQYEVGLTVLGGNAEVSLEILWWPGSRDIAVEPLRPEGATEQKPRTISGVVTAPEGADEAYLRIAVKDGSIKATSPSVSVFKK